MNRNLILGAALTSVFLLAALLRFLWTPYEHAALDIANKTKGPSPVLSTNQTLPTRDLV